MIQGQLLQDVVIRAGEKDGIWLEVTGGVHALVRVEVTDSGPGIHPEKLVYGTINNVTYIGFPSSLLTGGMGCEEHNQ